MQGADRICDEELWKGTARAAKGHLSQKLWATARAKEEGPNLATNWQDADSSSTKGCRYSFSNEQESKVMLCGGACWKGTWEKVGGTSNYVII